MSTTQTWCVIFVMAAACTCGARTECSETAQISLLTSVHDDPSCVKPSTKGVMLYEAAGLLAEAHNNRTDDFEIGITVLDTCGNITGALKATMKALVWADINCLHPPHYLGIIGPDTAANAEAVRKVTSILQVPHIVKKPSISPYLHPLAEESNSYLVQATLKIIETLKWRSFRLVASVDGENDEGVQNIARKLTSSAIARDLCVVVHDEADNTSRVVHIGKPEVKLLREPADATVLIVGEAGDTRERLNRMNSSNTLLLLEDSRIVIDGLERRVENSRWWTSESGRGKYDAKELRQVRWLEDAIGIYTKALKALCKNKRCKSQINPLDWNHVVSSVLMARNAESQAAPRLLDLSVKTKTGELEYLGGVIVREDRATIYWGERSELSQEESKKETEMNNGTGEDNYEDLPPAFRALLNRENEPRSRCATIIKETRLHGKDNQAVQVLVSGTDDNEWWTMVCTVSGVGVAMFLVGILAVYIIYTNIRGPRCPKGEDKLDRDTSLRRVGSDRELPATLISRNQQMSRVPQRTGSERSVSEKSV
ncbi:PREDICTED: uncharacterized protein LOC106748755 [Dinoponera quadriceps]|uniref:Uncharacterized protein LOC106748755 n=1 Tax=Dinoponera quadriceps TaxID=609295 RepID=A0A6P3XX10_DINQU|nr:PREDICTED: uncharacterized protein LOC106748755 [Dinoponera quadriceps]